MLNSTSPAAMKALHLLVGQAPHEVLVLSQATGREEALHQPAVVVVLRAIHGDHVLVHGHLVAVLVDDRAGVVAVDLDRQGGERSSRRVARRERLVVTEDRHLLVVAGDDGHVVAVVDPDRTLRLPQVLEVRVGVVEQRLVDEEVDRLRNRLRHVDGPPRRPFGKGSRVSNQTVVPDVRGYLHDG